jgi:carboxyl-terminal processing protease
LEIQAATGGTGTLMKLKIVLAILLSSLSVQAAESFTNAYTAIALFTQVLEEVHRSYVDTEEADYDTLIRHALSGMLQELDPYSVFMAKDAYEDMKDSTAGKFGGIGVVISMKNGMLTVVSPMEDTPGFRAGILSGDIIIEVDGQEVRKLTLSESVGLMRGEPGTEVKIKTLRPSTRNIEEITITREKINVASVKGAEMIQDGIGYIRITQFNKPTGEALKTELEKLLKEGMQGFVLDLRGNPGGLLSSAAEVVELFLPRGELIVFTRSREKEGGQQYKSSGLTHYTAKDFPMVILVNGGSASAAEIVAGALQDHKRAMLVGEKTFGKGSVQSVLPLEDGSAIKLTTAKYYTPSERVIHDNGIEPDHTVEMPAEDLFLLLTQKTQENGTEDEALPDDEPKLRDTQLEAAIGALKGMIISQEWTK